MNRETYIYIRDQLFVDLDPMDYTDDTAKELHAWFSSMLEEPIQATVNDIRLYMLYEEFGW